MVIRNKKRKRMLSSVLISVGLLSFICFKTNLTVPNPCAKQIVHVDPETYKVYKTDPPVPNP